MSHARITRSLPATTLFATLLLGAGMATPVEAGDEGRVLYWSIAGGLYRGCTTGGDYEEVIDVAGRCEALAIDPLNGHLYWFDPGVSAIRRSNLNGNGVSSLVEVGPDENIVSLVIDVSKGHIYWANETTDEIGRSNLSGNGVVTMHNTPFIQSMAVDVTVTPRRVYWSEAGPNPRIRRAKVSGDAFSGVKTIVSDLTLPRAVTVDAPNDRIMWADFGPGTGVIYAARRNGTEMQNLITLPQPRGGDAGVAEKITIDYSCERIFITDAINEAIHGYNFSGGDETLVYQLFEAQNPSGIVVADVPFRLKAPNDAEGSALGRRAGDRLGWAVAYSGRVDFGPDTDLMVGQPEYGNNDRGRVTVLAGELLGDDTVPGCGGEDSQVIFCVEGASGGDQMGFALASGKFNNDAPFDDMAFAAPRANSNGNNSGSVYVYSGNAIAGYPLLWEAHGQNGGDRFGYSLAGIGDVNDDGFEDLAVGAPFHDGGGSNAGRVYVLSGQDGSQIFKRNGQNSGDQFGRVVASAGDVNDDGVGDVIVGAPFHDGGGNDAGKVYVYSGADGSLLTSSRGNGGDRLGSSAVSLGDVDGDERDDIAVGAIGDDGRGTVTVMRGHNGKVLYRLRGEDNGDEFGTAVASMLDWTNDGVADLAVSAPRHDRTGEDAGRVYLFSGATGVRLGVIDGEKFEHRFGSSLSGDPRMTLEGRVGLLIGAWGFKSQGRTQRGKMYRYEFDNFCEICDDGTPDDEDDPDDDDE